MKWSTDYTISQWECKNCHSIDDTVYESVYPEGLVISQNEARKFFSQCWECHSSAEILMADGCVLTYRTYDDETDAWNDTHLNDDSRRVGQWHWGVPLGQNWDVEKQERIAPESDEIPF